MQKGSAQLFVVLVILLLLVSGGIYFFQNQKTSKVSRPIQNNNYGAYNNYKTYSNQTLGFQFQYQVKDFTVKDDSEEDFNKRGNGDFRKNFKGYVGYEPGQVLGAIAVLGKDEQYETNIFSVWVFNNAADLTIGQWFQNYWYYPFVWGVFDYTSKGHIALDKEATVSGQPAKYKIISYQPGSPKFVYASKDKKMYLFRVIGEPGEKILASFKMI